MFNDEDYGFLTGGLGDLDGDGDVDFGEYLNEEDDFERIMGTHDDYNSFSDDAYEDDDWKDIYTDTADKLGLDLDDYSDEDEFLEAVEEANEDTDDDSDSGYESTEQSGSFYPSHTCQTYMKNNVIDESIESRYRVPHGEYRIGDAIFDRFSEVRNNFTKNECDCIMDVIPKIYSVNKTLGLRILLWIIDNFPHALTSDYIAAVVPQSSQICSHIIFNFREIDEDSDKDIVFKYLSGKPELEVLIFEETYFNDIPISLLEYIKYCINNNLLKSFERVYFGFVKNKLVADYIKDRAKFIEEIIEYYYGHNLTKMPKKYYNYFIREMETLKKPLRQQQLLNKFKFHQDNCFDDEEENSPADTRIDSFVPEDIPANDEISSEEYKKLKNENKALKSKVTHLENRITDLNYNIQRLEAAIAAKKPRPKEWDGKYYRYCKVRLDISQNELWYRTDDITLKKGDCVLVPYGYQNKENIAEVISVEEFRSDDLPVPLEKTKFIIEKCDV